MLKRIFKAGFIALTSVVSLELTLRTCGWAILFYQSLTNPSVRLKDSNEFRIVVLGESTSAEFWSGGRELSWPRQFERNLNKAGLGRHFKVINLARGGTSTPFLVESFEHALADIKPHAVVSMMGINDAVFFEYAHGTGWGSLRIVKVWRWLRHGPPKMVPPIDPVSVDRIIQTINSLAGKLYTASPEEIQQVGQAVRKFASEQKGNEWFALEIGAWRFFEPAHRLYRERVGGRNAAARGEVLGVLAFEFAKESLKLQPLDANAAVCLTYASDVSHRGAEALSLIHQAMDRGMRPNSTLLTVSGLLNASDDSRLKEVLSEDGLIESKQKTFYQITVENYHRLADITRQNHIAYLAMQYPTGEVAALENIFSNHPMEFANFGYSIYAPFLSADRAPLYRDIFLVSNENFNQMVGASNYDEYFTDHFAVGTGGRFGHTTPKGHALIADNLTRAFVEHWPEISR